MPFIRLWRFGEPSPRRGEECIPTKECATLLSDIRESYKFDGRRHSDAKFTSSPGFYSYTHPIAPHTPMPGSKNTNYILDIMPEDRLFTDAHPDDLIIVSVLPHLLHPIFLIFFKCYGHDGGRKEHCAFSFRCVQTFHSNLVRTTGPVVHQQVLRRRGTHEGQSRPEILYEGNRRRNIDAPFNASSVSQPSPRAGRHAWLRRYQGGRIRNFEEDLRLACGSVSRLHSPQLDIHIKIDTESSRYGKSNMQVKVAGLVYLHNIGQNRMGRTSLLAHDLFHRICGPAALGKVVMASTHWETLLHNPAAGPVREKDLKEFLTESLSQGAVYQRIDATDPRRDIGEVIDYILGKNAVATQVQEELVELGKRVAETEAAQKLRETLESWLANTK